MKRFLHIAICAAVAVLSAACSLDEVNNRTPVADSYYATEDGASDLVNSIYSYVQSIYRVEIWSLTDSQDLKRRQLTMFVLMCSPRQDKQFIVSQYHSKLQRLLITMLMVHIP